MLVKIPISIFLIARLLHRNSKKTPHEYSLIQWYTPPLLKKYDRSPIYMRFLSWICLLPLTLVRQNHIIIYYAPYAFFSFLEAYLYLFENENPKEHVRSLLFAVQLKDWSTIAWELFLWAIFGLYLTLVGLRNGHIGVYAEWKWVADLPGWIVKDILRISNRPHNYPYVRTPSSHYLLHGQPN
jgi:hypothetical protein